MAAGRTSWFARDAAWHRRELIVELGDEFGGNTIAVLSVIDAWAQEQRGGGEVKGGYRILARESFVTVSHAVSIVTRAAELGVLDDLEMADDGRRFTCRVSGWQADAERGRAAVRQDAKRNRDADSPEQTVTDRDDVTDSTPSPLPHQTKEEKESVGASASAHPLDTLAARAVEVLSQCPRLRVERMGVENAIAAWPGRDHIRAAHTVVTWGTDPTFRQTNAAKLLGDALSKQTPEKTAAVDAKTERNQRRLGSLAAMTNGDTQ